MLYFTKRAIRQRFNRTILMTVAVSLAVGLLVSMITLSAGIKKRLSEELAAYGANAIVTSREYLDEGIVEELRRWRSDSSGRAVVEVIPELYGRLCLSLTPLSEGGETVNGLMINVIGMPREAMKGLKISGSLPSVGGLLIGRRLQEAGGLAIGQEIVLSTGCDSKGGEVIVGGEVTVGRTYRIDGVFERVGPEDRGIIMELQELQKILHLEKRLSLVMLRVEPEDFEKTISELRRHFPQLDIKAIRQIAISEEMLLKKIEMLMFIVFIVVIIASAITVAGIMAANIFERLTDIGLMKTMGGTNREIRLFFISEAIIVGMVSSIAGFFIGIVSAELISFSAFGKTVEIPFVALPIAIFTGLGLSILSGIVPVRKISGLRPAVILRGGI